VTTASGITCQSTRTQTCRRRLRRGRLWSGHFYVMWHWRRMHRVAASPGLCGWVARVRSSCRLVTLLGATRSHSGEPQACMAEPKLCRRHGFGQAARLALPYAPAGQPLREASCTGGSHASGLAASGAMPPVPFLDRWGTTTATHNISIDTDPQQQEAASPQMLVVRSFLRYTARPWR
jgi:hypothetical protein